MTVRVTRRYRFAASHRLHSKALSDLANGELFGKCNNPFGHGHNYELEVSVRGRVDASSGRAVDTGRLDQLVGRQVLQPLDHSNMNTDVPEFRELVPTTENLALVIERRLRQHWDGWFPNGEPSLEYIRVQETKNNKFQTADR